MPSKRWACELFEFPCKTKIITQMHIGVLLNTERGTVVENRSLNARRYGCDMVVVTPDLPLWQCLHCMISTKELYLGYRVCLNFCAVKIYPNKISCGKLGIALCSVLFFVWQCIN